MPSSELEQFLKDYLGERKEPPVKPKDDLRNHIAWKPSHPNEEPPF